MRRRMLASIGGAKWTNPYITDGLTHAWHAEWNAGGGEFDPDSTKIVDIAGDIDLATSARCTLTSKYIGVTNNLSSSVEMSISGGTSLDSSDVRTIECSFETDGTAVGGLSFCFPFTTGYGTRMVGCIPARNRIAGSQAYSGSSAIQYPTSFTNRRVTAAFVYDATGSTPKAGYVNGVKYSFSTSLGWYNLSVPNVGVQCFGGKWFAARTYSRELTLDEIRHNANVDAARFD